MNGLTRFIIGVGDQNFADGARFLVNLQDLQIALALSLRQSITLLFGLLARLGRRREFQQRALVAQDGCDARECDLRRRWFDDFRFDRGRRGFKPERIALHNDIPGVVFGAFF